MAAKKPRTKLEWWEPQWSYARRFRRSRKRTGWLSKTEYKPILILVTAAWVIALLSIIVILLIHYFETHSFWQLISKITLGGASVFIISNLWQPVLTGFAPQYIEISPKRLRGVFAKYFSIKPGDITSIRIVVFAPGIIRMHVMHYEDGEKEPLLRTIPVGSKINLVELSNVCPVKPEVIDARRLFAHLRRPPTPRRNPYQWQHDTK